MKIAVLRRNGLGDLLCAFPLVKHLQAIHPEAEITLFVDKRNAPLIPFLPKVHEVVVFPGTGNKYWNLLKTARRYRQKFDLAISAKTSPMKLNNFFLYALQAKKTVAYVDGKWHSRLIKQPIPYNAGLAACTHQALKGLRTVSPEMQEVPISLYPTLQVPEKIKEIYHPTIQGSSPIVLLSCTTTKPSSRLDVKRYAMHLNRLHETRPINAWIIGQQGDRDRAEAIASHLKMPHSTYFPRNFEEFMVLLDAAHLFFVGDGGVAHIGAALGKRVVALFGETNPVEWRPLSQQATTFYHHEHVDHLSDEMIFQELSTKLDEVIDCGRSNL